MTTPKLVKRRCQNPKCRRRFTIQEGSYESLIMQRVFDPWRYQYWYYCPDQSYIDKTLARISAVTSDSTRLRELAEFGSRHVRTRSCRHVAQELQDDVDDLVWLMSEEIIRDQEDLAVLEIDSPWVTAVKNGATNIFDIFKPPAK